MDFDFHLHIPENSQNAKIIADLAAKQHITPEEAARRVFDEGLRLHSDPSPMEQIWGAFSSPEDVALLDEAMAHVRELRETDKLRDFGA